MKYQLAYKDFIIYYSPRCACSSLKKWFASLGESNDLFDNKKKVFVVRNPINRFLSMLNFPISINIVGESGKKRIEKLLDYVEKTPMCHIDGHFTPQYLNAPNEPDHIIRIEDGDLIPTLNKLLGVKGKNYKENTLKDKLKRPELYNKEENFDYRKLEVINRDDLTPDNIRRIREFYKEDFKYYD